MIRHLGACLFVFIKVGTWRVDSLFPLCSILDCGSHLVCLFLNPLKTVVSDQHLWENSPGVSVAGNLGVQMISKQLHEPQTLDKNRETHISPNVHHASTHFPPVQRPH